MAKQGNQPTKSARTAREQAAATRAASQAAEKRRQRVINLVIAVVIGVVVVGIVGGALYVSNQKKADTGAVADPSAAVPTGGFPSGDPLAYGIPSGDGPVTVQVWEDFQCPACKAFEESAGENVRQLAQDGKIRLVTRVTTFLDRSFSTNNSRRAAAAYGCAVDAGKGAEYKTTVFANQPATEGEGWTDDQLVGFAGDAGITGDALTTFEQCFTDRVYLPWATNSTEEFYNNQIPGTPTVLVDGKKVETAQVVDPAAFQKLIDEAAGAQ